MESILNVKKELKPLVCGGCEYSGSATDYFKYYGLDFENDSCDVEHIFGTFESNGEILAGHTYKPAKYKATVFVLHGYLNHCAQMKHLIRHLLKNGYAVAAFDLPGHGLSTGERVAIDDFSQYGDALSDLINVVAQHLEPPCHIVAFSTGGSTAMEYLFTNENALFDKVILAAPLIRYYGWEQLRAVLGVYSLVADSVPRIHRRECSNKDYLKFVKTDSLQARTVPLKWVNALYAWNDKIADLPTCKAKVKVIQGTDDTTVDWKFNVDFIRKKFDNVEVTLIKNCRHEMFNESEEVRKKMLFALGMFFCLLIYF